VTPLRTDGYAPIREYAVIGDGRTAALVARDGAIDWLCLPDFDSPAVLAAILDTGRGGSFALGPVEQFQAERRYQDGTNVLDTTFRTASGVVRITDAMTLDSEGIAPLREVVRRAECLSGRVELRWRLEPQFDFGRRTPRFRKEANHLVATAGSDALALSVWGGDSEPSLAGDLALDAGESALLSLAAAHGSPLVLPRRDDAERRLEQATHFWRSWSGRATYGGPWRDAVVRSALVLKLLVYAPSGAILAAPTTSLPEWIGGDRNWDYRFSWIRDASYTLDALLNLGYDEEARSFFWWLMHATRRTRPRLEVLYRLSGGSSQERELHEFRGYRDSRPVRVGNGAVQQVQLDVYGALLNSIWLHVQRHGELEAETGRSVAKVADYVATAWRARDSGIWEVRSKPAHFVQSKVMCWAALERASQLAERGLIPDRRERWRAEMASIRDFVENEGWDDERRSYRRAVGHGAPDASLLTLFLVGYGDPRGERLQGTLAAVRRELSDGALVRRYRGEDGVGGDEGAFLPCSFWLVDALARSARVDEAAALMEDLVGLANDVGLYAEEIAPAGKEFLGNFPQALTHLALVNAAISLERAEADR
jgi:GH15 family glucan-1,4-alpha-glucosidase